MLLLFVIRNKKCDAGLASEGKTFSLRVVKIGHVVQTLEQGKLDILEKHVLIFCVLSWQFITLVIATQIILRLRTNRWGNILVLTLPSNKGLVCSVEGLN